MDIQKLYINLENACEKFINEMMWSYTGREKREYARFFKEMIFGIIATRSPLISNITRAVNRKAFTSTYKRLMRQLENNKIPWNEFIENIFYMSLDQVSLNDILAFDPGDISKEYAKKMEGLSYIYDGSKKETGIGYSILGLESIKWENEQKFQTPLLNKIIESSNNPFYISENYQIIKTISNILPKFKDKGTWTFDRGLDSAVFFDQLYLVKNFKWVVRLGTNRNILRGNDYSQKILLKDYDQNCFRTEGVFKLIHPKKSAPLKVFSEKIRIENCKIKKDINLITIKDERNKEPVYLATNLETPNPLDKICAFGTYLERWGKEEGYRFEKSTLNLEDIRVLGIDKVRKIIFLIDCTYLFISRFYMNNHHLLNYLCEKILDNFVNIQEIKYKYGRLVELFRLCILQHFGPKGILLTQIG